MENFRRHLRPPSEEYEVSVKNTDDYLAHVMLNENGLLKTTAGGRLWLLCQCTRKACTEKNSYSAARLFKIIKNSTPHQQLMNTNLKMEIERGFFLEPTYFFLDTASYKCKFENRHSTQRLIIMSRIIKDWR
jgi:hypothetical protein